MSEQKGLPATIVKPSYGGASNGGISSRVDSVTIVGLGEGTEVLRVTEAAPAVRLVKRYFADKPAFYFVPVDGGEGERTLGPMFGGSYISSSDQRFVDAVEGIYGAVPLHDRYESPAESEALSR